MTILNQGVGMLINSLPYFVLCFVPVWGSLRWKKKTIILCMIGLSLANMISVFLLMAFHPNWDSLRIAQSIIIFALYAFLYVLSIRVSLAKGIFIALFVKLYADLITSMAKFLEHAIWPTVGRGSYGFYFNLMHVLLLGVTFPFLWWFLRKKVRHAFSVQSTAWRYFVAIPAVFFVLNLTFTSMNTAIITNWQYVSFNIMIFISAGTITLVVLHMLERTRENARLEERVQSMNRLLDLQGEQVMEITNNISTVRTIRHDMRHQFAVLNNYAQDGDTERLREYLTQYIDSMPAETETAWCMNFAINAIAGHYFSIAQSEDIRLDVKMDIPEKVGNVPDIDLCIVIGNFLENALEACRRIKSNEAERFIRVRAQTQNEFLVITVDNSFDGIANKKDGVYLSRKKKDSGFGLESASAIAKKHNGDVEYRNDKSVFYSSVLIKI